MIRILCALAFTLTGAACVGPRVFGMTPETPAWLAQRIEEANSSNRGYPTLADVPPYTSTGRSRQAWEAGVREVWAQRAEVLADPILIDPDMEPGEADDVVSFTSATRNRTARDVARQTVED